MLKTLNINLTKAKKIIVYILISNSMENGNG